jgi:hypothetical protein
LITTAVAGSLIAIAGCGTSPNPNAAASSTPSTASTSTPSGAASTPASGSQPPAQAPPAGYEWLGSAQQRIWVAVPKTWVALDLSKLSYRAALRKFSVKGLPSSAVIADVQNLIKRHGLFAADVASASSSAHGFATNANAFCTSTPVEPGQGAATELDSGLRAEYASIHVQVISLKNRVVNANEVILVAQLSVPTTGGFALTEVQETDLTNGGKLCYLTLTTDTPGTYLPIFRKIVRTLHVD